MAIWAASCLHCAGPAPGASRLAACFCSATCAAAGRTELDRLEARLDLTRLAAGQQDGPLHAIDGMTSLQRRSRLAHALATWDRTDGAGRDTSTTAVVRSREARDRRPLSARVGT